VTDPEPNNVRTIFNGDGAIVNAHASRPISANLLEMERRMVRISFEKLIVFISEPLDILRKCSIELPKLGVGPVPHRSVHRPS
jgi:hypothetical protein